jgi:hypothetical protein
VIADSLCERVEDPVIGISSQRATGSGIVAFDAVTDGALIMPSHVADAIVGDQLTVKGGNFRFRGRSVGGITVTAGTIKSEGLDFGMAAETAYSDASYTIQVYTMTRSTGIRDIPGIVMDVAASYTVQNYTMTQSTGILDILVIVMNAGFWSSPYSGVSQICFMTAFTAISSSYVDADVETRVTSRPRLCIVSMAFLTFGQIRFGVITMLWPVAAIDRMQNRFWLSVIRWLNLVAISR